MTTVRDSVIDFLRRTGMTVMTVAIMLAAFIFPRALVEALGERAITRVFREGEAVPIEQRPQYLGLPRELVPQLDAGIAFEFAENRFLRDEPHRAALRVGADIQHRRPGVGDVVGTIGAGNRVAVAVAITVTVAVAGLGGVVVAGLFGLRVFCTTGRREGEAEASKQGKDVGGTQLGLHAQILLTSG